MIVPRVTGDEQCRDFIAHQFVNERIRLHKDIDRRFVESIHQMAEYGVVHGLCDGGRAAHIHEQHGQLDFRAAGELGCEKMTGGAISRILH